MEKKEKMSLYNRLVLPYHFCDAAMWSVLNGLPGKKMTIIGVTGTNGKTTTSMMIWKMLNNSGRKAGVMTTVGWGLDEIHRNKEHLTTASAKTLNKQLKQFYKAGAKYAVVEMSSHALAQHRALGVNVDVAVMTNVTHEHLNYHGGFTNYRNAKRKLFKKAEFGIVNADDPSAKYFINDVREYASYGINGGNMQAKEAKISASGVEYIIPCMNNLKIKTQIGGKFNIYNSLACVAVGRRLGLTDQEIQDGIFALDEVDGRMVKIDAGQDYEAMMDYAHTPDAFEQLLPDMKKSCKGRLIVTFGSTGGLRDPSKREPMGEVAGKYADIVVLTEDDNYETPAMEIIKDIAKGASKSGKVKDKDMFFEPKRTKAMELACKMAKKGDVLLFLGKSSDKTIEFDGKSLPWSERDEITKAIKKASKNK